MRFEIPLSAPDIGANEIGYVQEVMLSGKLSLGPVLQKFEQKFAATIGRKYAVAANSGTSALHLCVRAAGIEPGDEVITTSFSFIASTNCLLYERATPVFVDIDPATLNISPQEIAKFLARCCYRDEQGRVIDRETGARVRAILPVHVFGLPCDMDAICGLARSYGLSVIEDSCEAVGGTCRGRQAGTFGDLSCFAFYPNKQMTTAEGGMVVTDSEEFAKLCRSMRNQGRGEDGAWLQHERLGYNYRLSDIHAALGLAQLERLPEIMDKRERVARAYRSALSDIAHIHLLEEPAEMKRSWFVYVIRLDGSLPTGARNRVLGRLRSAGVGCQAYFPAIHRQAFLRELVRLPLGRLHETQMAADNSIALPFFSSLGGEQIRYVADRLREAVKEEFAHAGARGSAPGRSFEHQAAVRERL